MPAEPLTDREWWLVRQVQKRTLEALAEACARTGLPGNIIAHAMIGELKQEGMTGSHLRLRLVAEQLLKEYKPGADPR